MVLYKRFDCTIENKPTHNFISVNATNDGCVISEDIKVKDNGKLKNCINCRKNDSEYGEMVWTCYIRDGAEAVRVVQKKERDGEEDRRRYV